MWIVEWIWVGTEPTKYWKELSIIEMLETYFSNTWVISWVPCGWISKIAYLVCSQLNCIIVNAFHHIRPPPQKIETKNQSDPIERLLHGLFQFSQDHCDIVIKDYDFHFSIWQGSRKLSLIIPLSFKSVEGANILFK